ncbi:mannitol dehydrogenase family protein [Cryocola sp. 340MFSha3.1]|uniref:mannitol dehydrogenase family protein n=1 Tax=Cryocola sp. 340MFSha3.1 TaxID=1169145 RepID=UPI0003682A47|nr:mannitol dehydrogenase family protein [Cryocola sp. 340MFSha3.1]
MTTIDTATAPALTRRALAQPEPVPPVRIVHLGLGAFHRSHQAWYTARAEDSAEWGIAAFTGRTPDAAAALRTQEGVYTLVERDAQGDRYEAIGSIVEAWSGDDVTRFVRTVSAPAVAVVTLTITEAGYRLTAAGELDLDDPVVASDILLLRDLVVDGGTIPSTSPRTAPARLLLGLHARRQAEAPPVAIVPCDNLPANGDLVRRTLTRLAERVNPTLAAWLPQGASFVSTSVDRITPRLDPHDRALVAASTGWSDQVPVVAEPFSDWVLAGEFPSGRPRWETSGARFVDEIAPWEARKLWMLNGAHTLLASTGRLRGHATVAEAFADPDCRAEVERLWDEAAANLADVETRDYRSALAERFANPRIVHRLAQIAEGSETKLRLRIVPVAEAERAAGRAATGCATAIAAWIRQESPDSDVATVTRDLSPALGRDEHFVATVRHLLSTLPVGPTR